MLTALPAKRMKSRALAMIDLRILCLLVMSGLPVSLPAQEAANTTTEKSPNATTEEGASKVAPKVVTEAYVEELLIEYPAPSADDQPVSREHKLLIEAKNALAQTARWQRELTELDKRVETAEKDTQTFKEQAKLEQDPDTDHPGNIEEAELLLEQLKSRLDSTTTENQQLKSEISQFTEEKLSTATQLNEAKARLAELSKEGGGDIVDQALHSARIQQLQARIELLARTAATSDLRRAYATAKRELTDKQILWLGAGITSLSEHVEQLRKEALAKQEEEARQIIRQAALQDPILKELAEQNKDWIAQRKELSDQMAAQHTELEHFTQLTQSINSNLEKIEQRLAIAGYSQSVGALLQRERKRLPNLEDMADLRRKLSRQIRDVQLKLFEYELERNSIVSLPELKQAYLAQLPKLDDPKAQVVRDNLLEQLLQQHIEILDGLTADTSNYFEALINTDTSILEASAAVRSFQKFSAENALWIPDREPLSNHDIVVLPQILSDVFGQASHMVNDVFQNAMERLLVTVLGTILLLGVWRRFNRTLQPLRTKPLRECHFNDTLLLLGLEFFLAVIPVLFLLGVSWTVNTPIVDNEFSDAIAITSVRIIPGTISLMLLFRLTLPTNLGPQHFRWSEQTCKVIHDTVLHVMLPTYFIAFGATFLYFYGLEFDRNTGSRTLFLIALCLLIYAFHRVFHPNRGVFGDNGMRFGPLRHNSLRWLIYLGLLGWTSLITLLVVFGYMVGMMSMIRTTVLTVWLVAGIALLDGIITRYMRIHRYKALLLHRKEQQDASEEEIDADLDENQWREIDPQIRQIMNLLRIVIFVVGFAIIWRDALPAFRNMADLAVLGSSESPLLTLGQTTMLIVCIITTTVLAINLPSVIEIVIFRRIKGITPGNRHAFSTLVAYFIVLFGIIWASFIAEIEWSKVQWLIAAITVGLGFGMQEIFGNLVAGIILLFERPIRVGDIVTIDDTTGSISRIRIRGTTIREFDKREVIVPNKTIITGKLINWTLSDTQTRLKIPVSVAYGTDTDKVTEVLLDILAKHQHVVDDPAPRVFFIEMADSSLNFICFAYLASMDFRLDTQSELNHAIVKRFAEEGIEIPFPQRTLHISKEDQTTLDSANDS